MLDSLYSLQHRFSLNNLMVVSLFFAFLFSPSCKDKGVDPPPPGADTTSHNFTWTIDTLGDGSSSVLNDVAIINDTLAYAVGEIYLKDSTGQFETTPYSIAKWNGKKWSLQKLFYNTNSVISPIRGVWINSSTDIWLAAGSIFHWNGSGQQAQLVFSRLSLPDANATIEKLWATSSQNIYGVGNAGTIVFYNGSVWQKLTSGTSVDLVDIYGTGSGNIWIAGYDQITGQKSVLLHGGDGVFENRYEYQSPFRGERTDSMTGIVTSVWTENSSRVLVLDGGRVWDLPQNTRGNGTLSFTHDFTIGFLERMRGSKMNNVFAVGHFGTMIHYNGSSWRYYGEIEGALLKSVDVKQSEVMAVGYLGGRALVVRGHN